MAPDDLPSGGENGSKGSAAGIGSGDDAVCNTIRIDQREGTELSIRRSAMVARHEFPHVGTGEYEVTASYANDPNYAVKDATAHFDKDMPSYEVKAQDRTVAFGDEPFAVQAEVWNSDGDAIEDPALVYAQASSDDVPSSPARGCDLRDDLVVVVRI